MVDDDTFCILSACSWAWINTLISYTSSVSLTVIAQYTLRSTTYIGIALIFHQASANSVITLSVWSTRRWIARILFWRLYFYRKRIYKITSTDLRQFFLRGGIGLQFVNGSPVKPSWHVQIGVLFITLHCAPIPQEPGQGSLHFSRMQARRL